MAAPSKIAIKYFLRKIIGEPYVGKRMKLGYLNQFSKNRLPGHVNHILEVGCSDGLFTFWAKSVWPQAEIAAVDIDKDSIKECQQLIRDQKIDGIDFRASNVLDLKEKDKYDLVLALDVLEHIVEDQAAAANIFAALKPGGKFLVHVPNVTYTTFNGTVHRVPDDQAYTINPGHVRTGYSPESMNTLLTGAGFNIDDISTAHGAWSDAAHRAYCRFEHPSFLRIVALPIIDIFSWLDRHLQRTAGNTVFAIASKPLHSNQE